MGSPTSKQQQFQINRGFLIAGILILAAIGPAWMVWSGVERIGETGWSDVNYRPFLKATERTFKLLFWVSACSLLLGLPLGVLAGIFRFPGKAIGIAILLLPLAMPPFLWAIGVQSIQFYFGFEYQMWFDGFLGSVWTGLALSLGLVVLTTMAATRQLSQSQIDAALLVGKKSSMVKIFASQVLPAAGGAAILGGVLVVADPGAGQIMAYHGMSGDILVAFSARSDFGAAAAKALVTLLCFSPLIVFSVWAITRSIRFQNLSQGWKSNVSFVERTNWRWTAALLFFGIPLLIELAALAGLLRPLFRPPIERAIDQAWDMFSESFGTTLWYALGSATVASLIGLVAVWLLRSERKLVAPVVIVSLALLAIPSSINAIGFVLIASGMPPWLDGIFRSEALVVIAMGLRFAPLAILLLLVPVLQVPRSPYDAAQMHRLSLRDRIRACHIPFIGPAFLGTFGAITMISLADVSATVILQPPGGSSFGTHLFSVMDNASEKVVACLCLVYCIVPISLGVLYFLVDAIVRLVKWRRSLKT